jgi:phage repressor protein C with HTH and peptisase S24 domain
MDPGPPIERVGGDVNFLVRFRHNGSKSKKIDFDNDKNRYIRKKVEECRLSVGRRVMKNEKNQAVSTGPENSDYARHTQAALDGDPVAFSARLVEVLDLVGSRKNAAALVGVTYETLGNYVSGAAKPSFRVIARLAGLSGVSLDWLATGEEPKRRHQQPVSAQGLANDFVLIPRYDVAASAGAGAIIESDRLVDFLAFKKDWIRRTLALDPQRLAVISAEGDSMRPTIAEGDVLLVDTNITHVRDSAIYVLQLSGVLLVKRVRIRLDGGVDVISDNPAYPVESVAQRDLDHLEIAGRVVWHGGLV